MTIKRDNTSGSEISVSWLLAIGNNESGKREKHSLKSSLVTTDLKLICYLKICLAHRSGDNSTGGLECTNSNMILFAGFDIVPK